MPEMIRIFGRDLRFEMQGHLVEKVAHGFVTQSDCYSEAAVNAWWLTLKVPLHHDPS
jgi:hypothetical protein